jgi:hypothetical protein
MQAGGPFVRLLQQKKASHRCAAVIAMMFA